MRALMKLQFLLIKNVAARKRVIKKAGMCSSYSRLLACLLACMRACMHANMCAYVHACTNERTRQILPS